MKDELIEKLRQKIGNHFRVAISHAKYLIESWPPIWITVTSHRGILCAENLAHCYTTPPDDQQPTHRPAVAETYGLKGTARRFGLDRKIVRTRHRRLASSRPAGLMPRHPPTTRPRLCQEIVRPVKKPLQFRAQILGAKQIFEYCRSVIFKNTFGECMAQVRYTTAIER